MVLGEGTSAMTDLRRCLGDYICRQQACVASREGALHNLGGGRKILSSEGAWQTGAGAEGLWGAQAQVCAAVKEAQRWVGCRFEFQGGPPRSHLPGSAGPFNNLQQHARPFTQMHCQQVCSTSKFAAPVGKDKQHTL